MSNHKNGKKSKDAARAYKQNIKSAVIPPEGTVDSSNFNLMGSNEFGNPDISEVPKIAPLSWKIRAKRFIKKHTFETGLSIAVAILVAVVGWYGKTLIDLRVSHAVLETRINSLTTKIDNLDTNHITRELLTIQLEALRQELLQSQTIEKTEIEGRIALIEQQITFVQANSTGN